MPLSLATPLPCHTLFIRHAQSKANTNETKRHSIHPSQVELTETGHTQRQQLAEWLPRYAVHNRWKNLIVLLSPYARAQFTASPSITALRAAGVGLEVLTVDLLREHDTGLYSKESEVNDERWQNMRNLASAAGEYHTFNPPGGRALVDTEAELLFFNHMVASHMASGQWPRPPALVIFGHGLAGAIYIKMRLNKPWSWFWSRENRNLHHASPYLITAGPQPEGKYIFHPTPKTR